MVGLQLLFEFAPENVGAVVYIGDWDWKDPLPVWLINLVFGRTIQFHTTWSLPQSPHNMSAGFPPSK